MTVWNEFFLGFQHNMRNDYVTRNLREKERYYNALSERMHCFRLLLLLYAGTGRSKRTKTVLKIVCNSDMMGCPGKKHSRFTYSDASAIRENEKEGVSLYVRSSDLRLLDKVSASTLKCLYHGFKHPQPRKGRK